MPNLIPVIRRAPATTKATKALCVILIHLLGNSCLCQLSVFYEDIQMDNYWQPSGSTSSHPPYSKFIPLVSPSLALSVFFFLFPFSTPALKRSSFEANGLRNGVVKGSSVGSFAPFLTVFALPVLSNIHSICDEVHISFNLYFINLFNRDITF